MNAWWRKDSIGWSWGWWEWFAQIFLFKIDFFLMFVSGGIDLFEEGMDGVHVIIVLIVVDALSSLFTNFFLRFLRGFCTFFCSFQEIKFLRLVNHDFDEAIVELVDGSRSIQWHCLDVCNLQFGTNAIWLFSRIVRRFRIFHQKKVFSSRNLIAQIANLFHDHLNIHGFLINLCLTI